MVSRSLSCSVTLSLGFSGSSMMSEFPVCLPNFSPPSFNLLLKTPLPSHIPPGARRLLLPPRRPYQGSFYSTTFLPLPSLLELFTPSILAHSPLRLFRPASAYRKNVISLSPLIPSSLRTRIASIPPVRDVALFLPL